MAVLWYQMDPRPASTTKYPFRHSLGLCKRLRVSAPLYELEIRQSYFAWLSTAEPQVLFGVFTSYMQTRGTLYPYT